MDWLPVMAIVSAGIVVMVITKISSSPRKPSARQMSSNSVLPWIPIGPNIVEYIRPFGIDGPKFRAINWRPLKKDAAGGLAEIQYLYTGNLTKEAPLYPHKWFWNPENYNSLYGLEFEIIVTKEEGNQFDAAMHMLEHKLGIANSTIETLHEELQKATMPENARAAREKMEKRVKETEGIDGAWKGDEDAGAPSSLLGKIEGGT